MTRETYEEACKSAAEEQGVARIVAELSARGIAATVWQSGGFCMVAVVDLGDGWNVWANDENASLVLADGDGSEVDNVAGPRDDIAERIAAYVRRWREDIAAYRATRRYAEDLNEAMPAQAGLWPIGTAGWIYDGGDWIQKTGDDLGSVIVSRDEFAGPLTECEAYLWAMHGRLYR
jgi:hypothetical protein